MNLLQLYTGLLGMGIVLLALPFALRRARLCQPFTRCLDAHHTHGRPIPRVGGAALALAFVALEAFIWVVAPAERGATPGWWVLLLSSLAMFGLGLWDDLRPLGAKRKLLAQILIAALVWSCGLSIQVCTLPLLGWNVDLGGLSLVVTVLWLVGMTNLINLIDGVDGLAGGICLMLMLLMVFVGQQGGSFGLLASGMAGALLGFLVFNFPPAKVFLGDSGAYFLGFQIGLLSLIDSHKGTVFGALLAPLFVLALPLVDTSLAILRRGLRGLPLFRPDRRHLHHHLLEMGLSRRRVVLSFYAVTMVFLGMGLLTVWSRGHMAPLLFGLAVVLLLALAGRLKFSRDWFSVGRVIGNSLAMRNHVQYTSCLVRWLELEGGRVRSLEQLWHDLVFAAGKMGFSAIKLTGEDGCHAWRHPAVPEQAPAHVVEVDAGRQGRLDLQGLRISDSVSLAAGEPGLKAAGRDAVASGEALPLEAPLAWDRRTLQLVGELVAEGWMTAATRWRTQELRLNAYETDWKIDHRRALAGRGLLLWQGWSLPQILQRASGRGPDRRAAGRGRETNPGRQPAQA